MKKKILLLSISLLLMIGSTIAQRAVTGKVTSSDDGTGIPGVNVILKGTTSGKITDFDGNYSLELENDDATLQFSFIGFESVTVIVGDSDSVNASLSESDSSLDEVVVTGYGTQLRRNITGSVATIDSEVIENRALTSAGAALAGTTAGVFVSQNSGEAGQDLSLIHISEPTRPY
mgnify:CR=1 FL=1